MDRDEQSCFQRNGKSIGDVVDIGDVLYGLRGEFLQDTVGYGA